MDKYLIYNFKNNNISASIPSRILPTKRARKIKGLVTSVYRDVMNNRIDITINKEVISLKEPDIIISKDENTICFVYGNPDTVEAPDEQVFKELESISSSGGTINDALYNLKKSETKNIIFYLSKSDKTIKTKRKKPKNVSYPPEPI